MKNATKWVGDYGVLTSKKKFIAVGDIPLLNKTCNKLTLKKLKKLLINIINTTFE